MPIMIDPVDRLFLACGIVALKQLGVSSFSQFWDIWGDGAEPFPGQIKYTFWHVLIWSWFCNAAMHIGMSDLSVFRFAKKAKAGWTTAAGMYEWIQVNHKRLR